MISGKKCRHLNKAGVDITGQGGKSSPADFTIDWFLRHNHLSMGALPGLPELRFTLGR